MTVQHILVVCCGNTCRSPMAAALLGRLLGESVDVQSAGIDTGEGLPPTREAASVMQELGVDISTHRSRDIASLDLTEFDIVLAMTPSIADQLREAGVEASKITELQIPDPYGKGIDVYRSTAREIDAQLQSRFRTLEGGASLT